ncbi:hypothetical protein Fmac_024487 [Flemingia macrophylla]|uniref:RRM domain-containing protein n=1 Tax=Flemingia macrophylla TaxID=520843 RepID=A0ABD1LPI8_9FABA
MSRSSRSFMIRPLGGVGGLGLSPCLRWRKLKRRFSSLMAIIDSSNCNLKQSVSTLVDANISLHQTKQEPKGRALRVNVGPPPSKSENFHRFRALESLFREQRKVLEGRVIYDRESGQSRGFGFVTYNSPDEVNSTIQSLDGVHRVAPLQFRGHYLFLDSFGYLFRLGVGHLLLLHGSFAVVNYSGFLGLFDIVRVGLVVSSFCCYYSSCCSSYLEVELVFGIVDSCIGIVGSGVIVFYRKKRMDGSTDEEGYAVEKQHTTVVNKDFTDTGRQAQDYARRRKSVNLINVMCSAQAHAQRICA